MTNSCGSCTLCCTVMHVAEINKPADQRCKHCSKAGCTIYETRPEPCATFDCLYLQSQATDGRKGFSPKFRPDRCGVVMRSAKTSLGRDQLTLFARQSITNPKQLPNFLEKFTDGLVQRTNTPILLMTGNRAYGKFAPGKWKELKNTVQGWISKQEAEDGRREEAKPVC